jgi:hypothetical protein
MHGWMCASFFVLSLTAHTACCSWHHLYASRKQEEDEPDPEQIRKDMERLEMIKQKRCAGQQRQPPSIQQHSTSRGRHQKQRFCIAEPAVTTCGVMLTRLQQLHCWTAWSHCFLSHR